MKNLLNIRRSSQYTVLIFLIMQVIGIKGFGQTVDSNAIDGQIYVKVHTNENVSFTNFVSGGSMSGLPAEIQNLITDYSINIIEKAFPLVTNDNSIEKIYKFSFNEIEKVTLLISSIQKLTYIEYAEKVPLLKADCTTDYSNWAPAFNTQWDHLNLVNACGAWTINTGNANIRIAILDNEFDVTHPDLINKIPAPTANCQSVWDVADNDAIVVGPNSTYDHGTHVAGIVGAQTNNANGIASLGGNCSIMLGKVSTNGGGAIPSNGQAITHGFQGITWAVNNCADIINCSWGGPLWSASEQAIVNWAANQGVIIVAAAGNSGNSIQNYPAAYNNVFSVANSMQNDVVNPSSTFGNWIDISAPGTDIYSTLPSSLNGPNAYGDKTGTSMASPLVSALCGLIMSQNPAYTPQMVLNCIISSATNIYGIAGNANYAGMLGAGRINAFAALQCAQNPGNAAFFTANPTTICAGGTVQFTNQSVTNQAITSFSWNFGDGGTSNLANPTHTYINGGTYSVSLTIVSGGNSYNHTVTNMITVMGINMVTPAINLPICKGQEIQYNINFSGVPGFGINYNTGGPNINYLTNNTPGQIYFNTNPTGNTILHINSITSSNITCPINQDIVVNTTNCCIGNMIVNGDFTNGNTGFITNQLLATVACPLLNPGLYNVGIYSGPTAIAPGSTLYPTNKGNALYIDGRARMCGPGNWCSWINDWPTPTEQPCSNGNFPTQSSVIWRQNGIQFNSSYNYRLTFYTSQGNPIINTVQPLKLRVSVQGGGSFPAQIVQVPSTNNHSWQQFAIDITGNSLLGNSPGNTGNFDVVIEQFENFQWFNFDYILDEVRLFRYIPLTLATNLPGNNLQNNLTGTITATPASTAQAPFNYFWTRPNNTTANTGNNNTLTNVNAVGIYTCQITDANGCTNTATIQIYDFCNTANFPANVKQFTVANNTSTASQALVQFGNPGGVITSTTPIYISGIFTVDVPFQLVNCPNIVLAPNAEIILTNGATLTINNSNLSAACNEMWKGIKADNPSETIIINNSMLRDMHWGVDATAGARINVLNSTFIDNNVGIRIVNSPAGYNLATGNCIIRRNTFTSSGNPLLPPMQSQSKSEIGVFLQRCQEVEIGMLDPLEPILERNIFETLYTGIYSIPTPPYVPQTIKLYNNDYININADPYVGLWPTYQIIENCFLTRKGAGVYQDGYPTPLQPNTPTPNHLLVVKHVTDGAQFSNCDKAIVGTIISCIVKDVIINNSLMGIMLSSVDGQRLDIGSLEPFPGNLPTPEGRNFLNEVFIGIQTSGHPLQATIIYNDIKLRAMPIPIGYNNQVLWPTGIECMHFVNQANTYNIRYNYIASHAIGGRGIALSKGGYGNWIDNNNIQFVSLSTSSGIGYWGAPHIKGIELQYCNATRITENDLTGTPNFATVLTYPYRKSSGIYMTESPNMTIGCNNVDNFKEGFFVLGDCSTGSQRVTKNTFYDHEFPILFRHLGNEGTLGDIGNFNFNCDNQFLAPVNNIGGYRLYRMTSCPIQLLDDIYSQFGNLVQVQSGETGNSANNPACDYNVPNCNGCNTPSACNSVQFNPQNLGPISSGELDEEQARLVATDSMQYAEYNEVADWYGKYRLYERLDLDSLLMNSTPEFSGFYALQQLTQKEDILRTNLLLQSLIDSTLHSDTLLWQARVSQTWAQNSTISSGYDYENNEQELNAMYLTVLQYGYDTLNANQKQRLEELAYSCPFIEGPAVLKARMLHAHYSPGIDYNTLAICNAASVFKNGKGLFDDEDSLLNSLSGSPIKENHALRLSDEFSLYPNPSNGSINIQYNFTTDADMIFYDITGRVVYKAHLSKGATIEKIQLPSLVSGMYTYVVRRVNFVTLAGKIEIL